MIRSGSLFPALALLLVGCSAQSYDFPEGSALDEPPASIRGVPLPPKSNAIREKYTACHEVTDGKSVLGYAVVYQEIPLHDTGLERRFPTGTILVEDKEFNLIGFISAYGTATKFVGSREEELGKGTLDAMLPKFFGKKSVTHRSIGS